MIIIDSRTGSAELAPLFPPGSDTTVSKLDFGDFMFLGNGPDHTLVSVGIERKALKDLLNSMVTGRLSGHQLPGMAEQYDYTYLLVEGIWRFNPDTGVLEAMTGAFWTDVCLGPRRFMAKEVIAFLNTLVIKAGVHLLYSHNRKETVQVVTALYHWWNTKQFEQHTSHLSPSKAHKGAHGEIQLMKPTLVRRVASEISGIGWGKSKEVSEYFPTVLDMVQATEKEWTNIDGIGKGIAKTAFEELRGGSTHAKG